MGRLHVAMTSKPGSAAMEGDDTAGDDVKPESFREEARWIMARLARTWREHARSCAEDPEKTAEGHCTHILHAMVVEHLDVP